MITLEKVNVFILLVTISYTMVLSNLLSDIDDIQPQVGWLITFFTSVGFFRLLILLLYWPIHRFDALLALYHRNRFVKGLSEREIVETLKADAQKIKGERPAGIQKS